ncbi:OmpA family protein [Algibacter amylolyticus]|uniref:OmpA family protein n=1 Tax=Algibacter amylolyticus TaxID=1608400 RepID=A0A5M7BJZ2_9FLAO|nr:OmpA family protein [Algibacter amylolyticus]KAA5827834.1 OmpA family protein [Algibacter amylolyticus]MBB5267063.1 outer membrane protein OmpA-like peptidoglycan-associated protein [Algibacter amylolyticus]TSJ82079.1 OmpA family protein [Algibacter amylolyticus]
MKTKLCFFIVLACNFIIAQGPNNSIAFNNSPYNSTNTLPTYTVAKPVAISANGFNFDLLDAGVSTRYAEIGSGFFKNKLIMVSSKKIGGLAKIDPNTHEAFKELFCLDIDKNGSLSSPLLFSRIINTNASEDQLTFSPDENTVYYTRSSKDNSLEFKLYKAELEEDSHGNWINNQLLSVNDTNVSIETPFVNNTGDKLYFSANYPDAIGGFDLYVSTINADGTLGTPVNLGNTVNTVADEKYPSLSIDNKYLYFSSKGHENIGGYDLFVSKNSKNEFQVPRNMGNTINTVYDEIAYFLAARNKAYVSSNRPNGKGGYDIYTAINNEVVQFIKGEILDLETQIKLPNTIVILKDDEGNEIDKTITAEDATFSFNVSPFESYNISTQKDGFKDTTVQFFANSGSETTYKKDIELHTTEPVIAKVENEMRIVLENIYFNFNKWNVKEESFISLNKVIKVLKANPDMKLAVNAHTDNKGRDSYNLNLSNKRAVSAVSYLIENGISKDRLVSKGYGETKPLIDCKTSCSDGDLQANRRVEFVIVE